MRVRVVLGFCGDDGHLFPTTFLFKRDDFPHIRAAHDGHEIDFVLFLLQLFAFLPFSKKELPRHGKRRGQQHRQQRPCRKESEHAPGTPRHPRTGQRRTPAAPDAEYQLPAPAAMSFTTPAVMYRSGAGRSTVRSRLELTSSSAKTPHTMSVMRMYSVLPKP
jgi:hypothetical protein